MAKERSDSKAAVPRHIIKKYIEEHGQEHYEKHGFSKSQPICSCGNRNMASMGWDIICDQCHKYCGEIH